LLVGMDLVRHGQDQGGGTLEEVIGATELKLVRPEPQAQVSGSPCVNLPLGA
jgi:hypothetical protein